MRFLLALALAACAPHKPPAPPPIDALLEARAEAELEPQGDARVAKLAAVAEGYAQRGAERSAAGDEVDAAMQYGEALAIYAQIEAENPEASAIDAVWMAHAEALAAVGRRDEALQLATRVVRQRPESPLVPDAYMLLGDQYAAQKQQFKALTAYMKASAFPDYARGAEAQRKLSLCYYAVGEYGKALEGAQELADLPDGVNGMSPALREQVLRDLTVLFADSGEIAEAEAFFVLRERPDLLNDTRLRYAKALLEVGKTEAAYRELRTLIDSAPGSEQAKEAAKLLPGG